jgi:lipid-A-disaccharide synthase
VQAAVGVSSFLDFEFVKSFIREDFPVALIRSATHDVMKNSDTALVTSGTATLETACYQTPMVVVYKTSVFSYLIGRILINIKDIGLVNIVAGSRIVPELLQRDVNPGRLAGEALNLLVDENLRREISQKLSTVKAKLGSPGAARRVAEKILSIA